MLRKFWNETRNCLIWMTGPVSKFICKLRASKLVINNWIHLLPTVFFFIRLAFKMQISVAFE